MSLDARIEALEVKIAHLERALQELSDVVYRQQQQLTAQQQRHERLLEHLGSSEQAPASEQKFEIPPHY